MASRCASWSGTAAGSPMVPARPSVLMRMASPQRYTDPDHLLRSAAALYGGSARSDPERVTAHVHGPGRFASTRGYLPAA